MRLLQSGVDTAMFALWLEHEKISTSAIYLHAGNFPQAMGFGWDYAPGHQGRPVLSAGRSVGISAKPVIMQS